MVFWYHLNWFMASFFKFRWTSYEIEDLGIVSQYTWMHTYKIRWERCSVNWSYFLPWWIPAVSRCSLDMHLTSNLGFHILLFKAKKVRWWKLDHILQKYFSLKCFIREVTWQVFKRIFKKEENALEPLSAENENWWLM